jgi:hypothetical protein
LGWVGGGAGRNGHRIGLKGRVDLKISVNVNELDEDGCLWVSSVDYWTLLGIRNDLSQVRSYFLGHFIPDPTLQQEPVNC